MIIQVSTKTLATYPGSVSRRCPDISKARNDFGYNPEMNWKDAVRHTVNWYKEFFEKGSTPERGGLDLQKILLQKTDNMQRICDIFLSSLAILILSPIFIPIAIVLKFTGEGEIFYKQKRIGLNGKEFELLKFATMLNSPNIGAGEITIHNDPRVLPFGKFLRKTKINELPQLLNIITGDMSIVGPRPMVPNTFYNYSAEAQTMLNTVKPGLSGIGSIFFRDEERYL